MVRIVLAISILLQASICIASVKYYRNIYGNVLRNPSNYSASLTTVACGHPIKILEQKVISTKWSYVKVGAYKGYLPKVALTEKKPPCFQDKFPRFFSKFELDLAEYYYWGKLYNQYVEGKSKVR